MSRIEEISSASTAETGRGGDCGTGVGVGAGRAFSRVSKYHLNVVETPDSFFPHLLRSNVVDHLHDDGTRLLVSLPD